MLRFWYRTQADDRRCPMVPGPIAANGVKKKKNAELVFPFSALKRHRKKKKEYGRLQNEEERRKH